MSEQIKPTILDQDRKLYSLRVTDPDLIELIEIINDPDFIPPDFDDDDATAVISWAFWGLLICLPLVSLYLIGLIVGSGN